MDRVCSWFSVGLGFLCYQVCSFSCYFDCSVSVSCVCCGLRFLACDTFSSASSDLLSSGWVLCFPWPFCVCFLKSWVLTRVSFNYLSIMVPEFESPFSDLVESELKDELDEDV